MLYRRGSEAWATTKLERVLEPRRWHTAPDAHTYEQEESGGEGGGKFYGAGGVEEGPHAAACGVVVEKFVTRRVA